MEKKRYKIELDEEVVEKVKAKSTNSRISPLINNLLKVWTTSKTEVESLFGTVKKEEKEKIQKVKKKQVMSELKKISGD